jgi:protein phosphatase
MEHIVFNQKTAAGYVRFRNEDSHAVVHATDHSGALAVVCDGMGGAVGGEIASRIACETFYAYPQFAEGTGAASLLRNERRLRRLIGLANEKICDFTAEHPRYRGMGTTVAVLLFLEGHAVIAHVGDSRIYRLRTGRLDLLTHDQTLSELLVRAGRLTADQAFGHPGGNVLMQAVGVKPRLRKIESHAQACRPGDVYIVCSDGLSDLVPPSELEDIVRRTDPDMLCDRLVAAALRRGGKDNVTVVTAQVHAADAKARAA